MRLIHGVALLLVLSPGCRCASLLAGGATSDGYGEGHTTGPKGVKVPLGGPGRLGVLAFTDDGGFIAEETPLQESNPTVIHLFDSVGRQRGTVTVHRAAARLSRDGKVLGTASAGRVLALWNAHGGQPIRQWTAARPLRDVFFSPDGTQVADLDDTGAVRIFDLSSGKRVARLVEGEVETPRFDWSADGRILVVGRTFGQRVWELDTSSVERSESEDAGDLPFVSADGRYIASTRPNGGGVALTDRRTKRTTTAADGAFHLFSPDGRKLIAETRTHALAVIDLATNTRLLELKGPCQEVTSAAYSPDGTKLLASSADGSARLWDVVSGHELAGWHLPPDCALSFNPVIHAVAFSDDGRTLLLGFYEKQVELVTLPAALATARRPKTTPPPALVPPPRPPRAPGFGDTVATLGGFADVQFAPGSTAADWTLAAGAGDGTARLFHGGGMEEPEERATLGAPGRESVTRVAWSANGKVLAVGDHGGRVQLVDAASRKVLATVSLAPAEIASLAVSTDGALVAAGPRGTRIHVWRNDGTLLRELEGHTPVAGRDGELTEVTSLVFAPDGRTLFSGSNDFNNSSHGDLRRWDVTTGEREQLGDVSYLAGLSLSRDGTLLASGEGNTVVVRDLRTKKETGHTLRGHTGRVRATAFLPDGRTLASVDDDAPVVRLWDVASGEELAKLEGEGQRCSDAWLSVSSDGKLAAGSFNCAGDGVRIFWLAGLPAPKAKPVEVQAPKPLKPPVKKEPARHLAPGELFR